MLRYPVFLVKSVSPPTEQISPYYFLTSKMQEFEEEVELQPSALHCGVKPAAMICKRIQRKQMFLVCRSEELFQYVRRFTFGDYTRLK